MYTWKYHRKFPDPLFLKRLRNVAFNLTACKKFSIQWWTIQLTMKQMHWPTTTGQPPALTILCMYCTGGTECFSYTIVSCRTPDNCQIFTSSVIVSQAQTKCPDFNWGRCWHYMYRYSNYDCPAFVYTFLRLEIRLFLPQGQYITHAKELTQEMSVIAVLWPPTLCDPLSASLSLQPFLLEGNNLSTIPAVWVPFQQLTACKISDMSLQ